MQKIYHIFISSTYSDLREERRRVSEAIAKAGYVPEGMEIFPASSQKQLEFIKRVIDRCDYYVVIVGGRYGTIADGNVSYTEQEYQYALERGIPTLAFLHRHPEKIESGKVDGDAKKKAALAAFREKLASSAMVDFWDAPESLATEVVVAIGQEVNLNPGIGWVRGDNALDPKVLEELETSRQRIRDLEQQVQVNGADVVSFPSFIEPIESTLSFDVELQVKTRVVASTVPQVSPTRQTLTTTWRAAFLSIGADLYRPTSESACCTMIAQRAPRSEPTDLAENQTLTVRFLGDPTTFRHQFEALGLVRAEYLVGSLQRQVTWELTEKGRQYLAQSKARQRAPQEN